MVSEPVVSALLYLCELTAIEIEGKTKIRGNQ